MGRAVAASPPADGAADATRLGDAPVDPAPAASTAPQQPPATPAGEAAARLQRLALGGGLRSKEPPDAAAAVDSPRGSGGGSPRAPAVVQIGFDAPPLPPGGEGPGRERGAAGVAPRADAAAHSALHRTLSRDSLLREELSGGASPRSGSSFGSAGSLTGSPLRPPAAASAAAQPPQPPPGAPPPLAAPRAAPATPQQPVWPPPRAPGPRGGAGGAASGGVSWAPAPAISVPQRRPSESSASTELASPPPSLSPSPLSPLWLRSPSGGASGGGGGPAGGSFGARRPLARADSGGPPGRTLLGSFEQSLLSGRALWGRAPPQRLPGFTAVLCVRAVGEAQTRAPAKRRLPFAAECSAGAPGGAAPPYCASIALDGSGGAGGVGGERIRVPLRGELVLVLSNPEATPLHTFRVPYDLGAPLLQQEAAEAREPRAPAPAAKAYVRQRVFAVPRNGPPHAVGTLRYALQLRFVSPAARPARAGSARRGGGDDATATASADGDAPPQQPRRKLYLQGDLRVVFPPRRPDDDAETLRVQQDTPVIEAAREPGAAYSESV